MCTQFAWCGKNYLVYGTHSIATSSWAGDNLVHGLVSAGEGNLLKQFILAEEERYPKWFIKMIRDIGLECWTLNPEVRRYLPEEIRQRDTQIQMILQNTNTPQNSVADRVISDLYMAACTRFYLRNPRIGAAKFVASYKLFWQPIRNYTNIMLIDPLFTYPNIVENSFDLVRTVKGALREGFCDNQFVYDTIVGNDRWGGRRACFLTVPVLPLLMLAANIVTIHVLAPIILIFSVICFAAGRRILFGRDYLYLFGTFIYASLLMNLSEYGENMRFRLSIEPMIWLLSVYTSVIAFHCVLALTSKLRNYLRSLQEE